MVRRKIKRILVPLDGSRASFSAASQAIDIARGMNGRVVLFHAVEKPSSILEYLSPIGAVPLYLEPKAGRRLREKIRKKVYSWFDRIEEDANRNNIIVKKEIMFLSTSVPQSIISYAKEKKMDMIVMGTRGKGGFKGMLMGSVTRNVLEHSEAPVLVVK